MRVMLAVDGSPAAESARRLARSLQWPQGTVIDVVSVHDPATELVGIGDLNVAASYGAGDVLQALQRMLAVSAAGLEAPGLIVTRALLEGRPASALVDYAGESRAELLVIGSRGLGPIRSMLLGSVSAEVVDHAPCPVLVVRGVGFERILLAVDGSPSARAAATFLGGWRSVVDRPVEVLTVAVVPPPPLPRIRVPTTTLPDVELVLHDAEVRAHRERAEVVASRAAGAVREDGFAARWSIAQGDPAHEILEAVQSLDTGLVVLGSRGHSGLKRVLLGSVARNVLLHTEASVLIVREPIRARSRQRAHHTAWAPGMTRLGLATDRPSTS